MPCVKRDIPVARGTLTGIYSAFNVLGGAGDFRLTSGVVPSDTFSDPEAFALSCGAAVFSCEGVVSSSAGCVCAVSALPCAASVLRCAVSAFPCTGALLDFLARFGCADILFDEFPGWESRCSAELDAWDVDPDTCGFGRRNEGRGAPLTSDGLYDRDRDDPTARLRPEFFFLIDVAPVSPDVSEGVVCASAKRRAPAGVRPTCRKEGVSFLRSELCDADVRRRALTGVVEVWETGKCASTRL